MSLEKDVVEQLEELCKDHVEKKPVKRPSLKELKIKVRKQSKHFKETGELLCINCDKPMTNQIDSITGKVSEYLWRCDKCMPEGLILSVG